MSIKKIAASFLAAVMLTGSAVATSAFAVDTVITDGILDEETGLLFVPLEDGTLLASVPNGATISGDIAIPEMFGEGEDAKPVTQIRYEMVFSNSMMTSLHIPKTVVAFNTDGGYSSSYTSSLQSITVDEDNPVFSSEDGVLFNKDKTEIIKYPHNKASEEYVIPSTVTTLGTMCFTSDKLQSVVIPHSVKEIGWEVFWECHALTKISIPSSVESIGGNFISGSAVSEITVDSENTNFCAIDNVLFSADKTTLIAFPPKYEIEKYIIPDGTEVLSSSSFIGSGLKEVDIPESVIEMTGAFSGCRNLISAKVPDKVTDISYTFNGCKSLENITLPLSLKKIGLFTFDDCNLLKKIYYAGTQEDWDKIEIGNYNEPLKNATIYFSDGTTGGADIPDTTDTVVQEPSVTETYGIKEFTPGVKKNINTSDADIETMKNIKANAPSDAFDNDVVLNVSRDTFSAGGGTSFAVDISFVKADGTKVQPTRPVTVQIPVPENLKNKDPLYVYHINESGRAEKVEARTKEIGGVKYVVFEADRFSTYAVTDKEINEIVPSNPVLPTIPNEPTTSTAPASSIPDTSSEPTSTVDSAPESTDNTTSTAPSTTDNNPTTGIAMSALPLIAAVSAVIVIKKKK